MAKIPFQSIGPLSQGAVLYIERGAEREALEILRSESPAFMLITEPRQQGKTSFINYLLGNQDLKHCCFLGLNLARLTARLSETEWYTLLGREAQNQIAPCVSLNESLSSCVSQEQWREQLLIIGKAALAQKKLIVIILDEVGRLPVSWRESFFAAVCEVRDSRATMRPFNAITFLFVGSFHPEDMITDGSISPFNKALPLSLDDFTAAQVTTLLERAEVSEAIVKILQPRLMYWTDGQPYLVQELCRQLFMNDPAALTQEEIDVAAQRLERKDSILLPPIFRKIRSSKLYRQRAERVLNSENIEFAPASVRWQAELASFGLIKEEKSTGRCVVRNAIYARALRRLLQEQPDVVDATEQRDAIRQHIEQRLIEEHERRQEKLQIIAARYGKDAPPHIMNEIEDIDKEIARLREQIPLLYGSSNVESNG